MARTGAWALIVAASVAIAPASVARAWTDATVRSASAHLAITPRAGAVVTIVAEVRVEGGWLEGFEIDGLDSDLELVPELPPTFEASSGARYAPSVEHRGEGRVVFGFRRRDAPHRGDYVATIVYRTAIATELRQDDRVRLHWTLPSWRFGLDDVAITIDAPDGAEPVPVEGDEASVSIVQLDTDSGSRVVLRRVHLPRTREWSIAVDVPAASMDPAVRAPPVGARPLVIAAVPEADGSSPLGALVLVLLLALLALAKIAAVARAERDVRVEPSAIVPLGAPTRAAIVVALALAAWLLGPSSAGALALLAGIAALAIHRRADAPRPPRLGAFRAATDADLRAAPRALRVERMGLASLLDAASVPGAIVLASIAALPVVAWSRGDLPVALEHGMWAAALAATMLLSGTRRSRPAPPLVELAHLVSLAARSRVDLESDRRWMMRPVLHSDVRGVAQEARLRIVLPSAPKGLLRLDVVRAARPARTGWSAELSLLVVARDGSPVDRALEERFPGTKIAEAPRRIARQLPLDGAIALERAVQEVLTPVLEAVAACPIEAAPRILAAETPELAATA